MVGVIGRISWLSMLGGGIRVWVWVLWGGGRIDGVGLGCGLVLGWVERGWVGFGREDGEGRGGKGRRGKREMGRGRFAGLC